MMTAIGCMLTLNANAQLSTNPDKFLGNITTDWTYMDFDGFKFSDYWNQVTPENATKWGCVEAPRGQYNWWNADIAANYASQHGFPFKFHTLIWGSQYPEWMDNLSTDQQYQAIVQWYDAVKAHYPNLEMIDVVNEAIAGHAPAPFKNALGGDGVTGYDWIIKAFEMAAERWPDAILIYNDYNTFNYNTYDFINLVKTLRDAGAPIDAYGCQSHDLGGMTGSNFSTVMATIQNALKMPMYITEYDIGDNSDASQKWNYMEHFPVMWEADYCAGVTIWGWIYGHTWLGNENNGTKGNSGLIKNKVERSALTWLRDYMQTAAAKNAKSPFPGMKKEASVYIKADKIVLSANEKVNISISARVKNKTIQKIELYLNGSLYKTFTSAPYTTDYTPASAGDYQLKAVVTTTDGKKYERIGGFKVYPPRTPYNGAITVPGTIEFENFDKGADGLTFHDSDTNNEGTSAYRTDGGGVDIVTGNNGYAIGYTATGEWLEYTLNVTKAGEYAFEAYASHGNNVQAGFDISLVTDGQNVQLAHVNITQTDDNKWSTYNKFTGSFSKQLPAGKQILRVTITGPYINLDKMTLTCTKETNGINTPVVTEETQGAMYNLAGQRVDDSYKGIVIINGRKVVRR